MDEVKTTKPRRLSKKQKGFVKDYVATGNGTQAILNNYDIKGKDPEKTASVMAVENLGKPSIANAILSIAEQIPDEELLRVHREGLNASDELIIEGKSVGAKPDYAVRHKYLDSAYKLKGVYAPEKTVNLNVEVSVDENDLSLAKNLLDQRRGSKTSSAPSDGVIPEPMGGEVQD